MCSECMSTLVPYNLAVSVPAGSRHRPGDARHLQDVLGPHGAGRTRHPDGVSGKHRESKAAAGPAAAGPAAARAAAAAVLVVVVAAAAVLVVAAAAARAAAAKAAAAAAAAVKAAL